MDRDEFCSILQKEYDILFEKWYQYTQQLGPLHEELRSLKDLVNKVNGSDHLIVHFVVSIKETIFNRLVASFKSASKRIATLECAIEKLESRNTIYCHLDHFSVEEYPLYFTNCPYDKGRRRIRVLSDEVKELKICRKRIKSIDNDVQTDNDKSNKFNRFEEKLSKEEESNPELVKIQQDIELRETEIGAIVDDLGVDLLF